jgi:hypothetical protein
MLLYGDEVWTITTAEQKGLEAKQTRFYRKTMKIKWTERITDEEVLRRAGKSSNIMSTVSFSARKPSRPPLHSRPTLMMFQC